MKYFGKYKNKINLLWLVILEEYDEEYIDLEDLKLIEEHLNNLVDKVSEKIEEEENRKTHWAEIEWGNRYE